jgi:hypothetical protein
LDESTNALQSMAVYAFNCHGPVTHHRRFVSIAGGRRYAKRSFNGDKEIHKQSHDPQIPWPTAIRLMCSDTGSRNLRSARSIADICNR